MLYISKTTTTKIIISSFSPLSTSLFPKNKNQKIGSDVVFKWMHKKVDDGFSCSSKYIILVRRLKKTRRV